MLRKIISHSASPSGLLKSAGVRMSNLRVSEKAQMGLNTSERDLASVFNRAQLEPYPGEKTLLTDFPKDWAVESCTLYISKSGNRRVPVVIFYSKDTIRP